MIPSPQRIRVAQSGAVHPATVSWRRDDRLWVVSIASDAFEAVEARADDAFEALCRVRDVLEPLGWRIGVAGAQPDVWPSGMARDQGRGLSAYRMTPEAITGVVETFEPVDPASVTTVAEQRLEADRLYAAIERANLGG
ncbi:hypothetical protein [Microbacterium tumbae]